MPNHPSILTALLFLVPGLTFAGEVDVVDARPIKNSEGVYHFDVTLRHGDEGWDHYADRWEVMDEHGKVLGTRTLLHPHVDEQPFTRGLSGVQIPPDVKRVVVRGHDSVHGYTGETITLDLP